MLGLISIVGLICSLAAFVLGILCAIKMFQANQIWQGILTIICWIFGVIYVFQKKDELGLEKLALPYAAAGVASIICNVLVKVMATSGV